MTAILPPLFVQVALTLVLYAILASFRFYEAFSNPKIGKAVKERRVDAYTKRTLWLSDNVKNQFELPILFYAAIILAIAADRPISDGLITLAWTFVGLRVVHTILQVSVNIVLLRFLVFFAGYVTVILMWLHLFRQLMAG